MNKTKHYYFNQMAKIKAVSQLKRDSFFYIHNKFELIKLGVCESKTIAKAANTVARTAITITAFLLNFRFISLQINKAQISQTATTEIIIAIDFQSQDNSSKKFIYRSPLSDLFEAK